MAEGFSRDRLQPALLDRLIDEAPTERNEAPESRMITKSRLRASVLRDLSWLLNSIASWGPGDAVPDHVRRSVLNFGMPPLAGRYASKFDMAELERSLLEAVLAFEPRLLADTVRIRAHQAEEAMGRHNILEFELSAELWAQPYPIEMLMKTRLDVETGQVEVHEVGASVADLR